MAATESNRSFEGLKNRLREQLQARGLAGAAPHGRAEGLAFDKPLAEWRSGDRETVRDLSRATVQLVEEVPENGWTADTLEWLAGFIERAPVREAMYALETVVHRKKWLTTVDDGNRAHMLALRTLRGLSWKADPNFWLGLPDDFKKRYPSLVFGGLADHNLDLAFERLPTLAADTDAARKISRLFASLVETKGADAVWQRLAAVRSSLQRDVAALFEKWFEVRNFARPRIVAAVGIATSQKADAWVPFSKNGPLLESLFVKRPQLAGAI
jgi:hypothetical protein